MLDAFCFSGGFGITAAKLGGAASVLGLDSSESALVLAKANAELNGVLIDVAGSEAMFDRRWNQWQGRALRSTP